MIESAKKTMFGQMSSAGDDLAPLPSVGRTGKARAIPGAPADLMRRCAAVAIDLPLAVGAILGPLLLLDPVLEALSITGGDARTVWHTTAFVWLAVFILVYSPLCVSRWGGSLGKRVLGIEVVRASDGARLGYGQAVLRHLINLVANAVPVILIAHVSAINLSANKQGIHDKTVGSVVIHRRYEEGTGAESAHGARSGVQWRGGGG
ncbi:RDD family protein, partial [Streptomyces sp900116325]|uniref:RDD family protein n=1 Tax=Streptomyces sp. 900116325 TaxID=3154295 RepID=UPI0033A078F1